MAVVGIWSGKNYLKHAVAGSDTMGKPDTSDGGLGFFSTKTVVHNLGYIPLVRAYYDPDNDGKIFPTIGQFSGSGVGLSTTSPFFGVPAFADVVPFCFFVDEVTTTTVVLRTYSTGSLSGTFPFYYRIYIDPTL